MLLHLFPNGKFIGVRSGDRRAYENGTQSQNQLPHTTIIGHISHRVPCNKFCPTARGTSSTNPEEQFPQHYDNTEQIAWQVTFRAQDDFLDHANWSFCVRFSRCAHVSVVDVKHTVMRTTLFVGPPKFVYRIDHVTLWRVLLIFIPPRLSKQPDTFLSKRGFL